MSDCEEITGIAAGDNFVAVATDAGFVRFFSTMGTQREVIVIPGPVVAMSAMSNNLAIAYHTATTCNKFSLMIVSLTGPSLKSRTVELPLTAGSKLSWLGFSDMGSIIAHDSSGRVISYSIKRNLFYPICDMNNHVVGVSDNFFIISVSERDQKIRATLCRGTSFPVTNPRPIVREVDYLMPFCYMESERSQLEETLMRAVTFNVDSSEKIIVEKGLKLFSTAINSELESRAYEIVELISNKKLIELAAKYAAQKGHRTMANKISKLLMDFEEKERQKEALIEAFEQEGEEHAEVHEIQAAQTYDKRSQETSTPVIAPKPMMSFKKSNNPFRKSSSKVSTPTGALSHLTKKSIGYSESSHNSDDENTPTNSISLKTNRSFAMDTPRPGNFAQWFIANKADLIAENQDSSDSELMKVGKALYKELTQKQKTPNDDTAPEQKTSTINKRKLNMNEVESGGVAKLAKFGFNE